MLMSKSLAERTQWFCAHGHPTIVQASSASPCGVGGRRRARAGVWGAWGGAGQHGGAHRALDVVEVPSPLEPHLTKKQAAQMLAALHSDAEETWNGQRILLHPLTWTSDSLTPQPDQRPPASADCWDMRRAGWVRSDGSSAASVSRAVIQHRWYQNTRGCATETRPPAPGSSLAATLTPGDGPGLPASNIPPPGRGHERELAKWRIRNGDLFIGPLGGVHGEHRCSHCNAPLFLNEARTKC